MAHKSDLRRNRAGTVINLTSRQQETELGKALLQTVEKLQNSSGLVLVHEKQWLLRDITSRLEKDFPAVPFAKVQERSSVRPDGGDFYRSKYGRNALKRL